MANSIMRQGVPRKEPFMSHPKDRRERFLVGVKKSRRRVADWFSFYGREKREEERELAARHLRDTTKRCGESCCTNPRKNGWAKGGGLTFQEERFLESLKVL